MALDLTGIQNENEFYTSYYLREVLGKDLKNEFSDWADQADQGRPPDDAFGGLSEEHQDAVRTAMRTAVEWQREEAAKLDLEFREKLVKEGMQFDPLPDSERERLRKATMGIAEQLKERVDPEVIDLVLSEVSE